MVRRYPKQTWSDLPSQTTPISAARLGVIEAGIELIGGFVWANAAARAAETGMAINDRGYQTDTNVNWRYNGSTWKEWESDWISWTPTFGSQGGTGMTTANVSADYKWISGAMQVRFNFQVNAAGTATGYITVSMPSGYTIAFDGIGDSYNVSGGTTGRTELPGGGTDMRVARYDNATFIGAGNFLRGQATIRI